MFLTAYFNFTVCIVQFACILFPETGDKFFAWVSRTNSPAICSARALGLPLRGTAQGRVAVPLWEMERWNKPVNGNIWTGMKLKFLKVFIPNSNCSPYCVSCCLSSGEDIWTIVYCYYCGVQIVKEKMFLDLKLSARSECCVLSFRCFLIVWIVFADVSEHTVVSS
jgi:hypothetical protein